MKLELYSILPNSGLADKLMVYSPSTGACSTYDNLQKAIQSVLENGHHYFNPLTDGELWLTFDSAEDLCSTHPELFI